MALPPGYSGTFAYTLKYAPQRRVPPSGRADPVMRIGSIARDDRQTGADERHGAVREEGAASALNVGANRPLVAVGRECPN